MSKDEFLDVLEASPLWTKDRFGHYKRIVFEGTVKTLYRIKIQANSVRLEKKLSTDKDGWFKISSSFYKDIKRTKVGNHVIGNRVVTITRE